MALLSIHLLTELSMARPIKETPILTGKDAELFLETVSKMEALKMSKEEMDEINSSYKRLAALMHS